MESTSQETDTASQPNRRPSLSALADAIAKQEQFFEQSLESQQLWAKQLADAQEAKIKEAVQKIKVGAAEVNEILKGKDIIMSEVKPEGFNSKRDDGKWEPQLHRPTWEFSTSKSRSTSLTRYSETEVYKEHRRYSPGDHASKRDLCNFDSDTRIDHYKDHQKPRSGGSRYWPGDSKGRNYRRMSKSPDDDTSPHYGRSIDSRKHRGRRSASPSKRGSTRERTPSKSRRQRNLHEDSDRSIDSRKHRERRDASPLEKSRKRERSPYKSEHRNYHREVSYSPRFGSSRYRTGDRRAKDYRRAHRSPVDDSNPNHGKSIDSRKHREKRGTSLLEKSKHLAAENQDDCHRNYCDEKTPEPTRRNECLTKQASDSINQNHASENLCAGKDKTWQRTLYEEETEKDGGLKSETGENKMKETPSLALSF